MALLPDSKKRGREGLLKWRTRSPGFKESTGRDRWTPSFKLQCVRLAFHLKHTCVRPVLTIARAILCPEKPLPEVGDFPDDGSARGFMIHLDNLHTLGRRNLHDLDLYIKRSV